MVFGLSKVHFIRILTAAMGTNLHTAKYVADIVWAFHGQDTGSEISGQNLWDGLRLARLIIEKLPSFYRFK